MTPEARRQRLHREYNQEVQTLEIAALCLADFPDAPWELRLELGAPVLGRGAACGPALPAPQELGGLEGQYPIANLDWSVVAMLDSLAGAAGGPAPHVRGGVPGHRDARPSRCSGRWATTTTADIMEAIEADEIQHVRFANDWLKRLADAEPRTVLQVAAAMAWLRAGGGGDRRRRAARRSRPAPRAGELAGFSPAEIAEVTRLERQVAGSTTTGRRPTRR